MTILLLYDKNKVISFAILKSIQIIFSVNQEIE